MPPKITYEDGSLRERTPGKYEYRFMHEGKQLSVFGSSKQICFDKRTEIITGKSKKRERKISYTFGEWNIKFFNTYKVNKFGKKTNPNLEGYIFKQINPKLGSLQLKNLTGLHIQEFLKDFDDRTNTRQKIAEFINESLKMAVANDLLRKNPMAGVKIERHVRKSYPVIHPKEQTLLLQEIQNPKYLALFWYMCGTGLRITEAIESIPHIDFERNIVHVQGEDTKTKKHQRIVPFLPELLPPERYELLKDITVVAAGSYFERLCKKLNIKIVLHSFRHTFASCAHRVGIPDKYIQKWLGHSSITTTMDIYVDLIEGESPILDYFRKLKNELNL